MLANVPIHAGFHASNMKQARALFNRRLTREAKVSGDSTTAVLRARPQFVDGLNRRHRDRSLAVTSASDGMKNCARDDAGDSIIDKYFQLQTRSEVFVPQTAPSEVVSRLLGFVRVQFADNVVGQISGQSLLLLWTEPFRWTARGLIYHSEHDLCLKKGTQLPESSGNPDDSLFRIETRSFNLHRGEPRVSQERSVFFRFWTLICWHD